MSAIDNNKGAILPTLQALGMTSVLTHNENIRAFASCIERT
ncbi:hypothetical protein UUU_13540 [Klebsiella pneumoniae subsp. pneumoniae DSM 30104 = JCM 1662 = NBRC 14940]|nr:hypothetical protein UUU_13540 [Klebsiella pneumoniae subsp. pneumoniae DSM 30104 = JCM 1662 = NBRC 14940]